MFLARTQAIRPLLSINCKYLISKYFCWHGLSKNAHYKCIGFITFSIWADKICIIHVYSVWVCNMNCNSRHACSLIMYTEVSCSVKTCVTGIALIEHKYTNTDMYNNCKSTSYSCVCVPSNLQICDKFDYVSVLVFLKTF